MAHIPDDKDFDEYMNASAEEWSKPNKPADKPAAQPEPTDRWGSPIQSKNTASDPSRWGSEQSDSTGQTAQQTNKGGKKGWVIAVIVVAVICLCVCVVLSGLQILNLVNLF